MTAKKEKGRIVRGGMGGFLNPPTHPEHDFHVETDLRRRPENRGDMSLSAAVDCEYLESGTRADAHRLIVRWDPPPIDSPEVVAWRRQVLGYFRGCYRNPDAPAGAEWHASSLVIDRTRDPLFYVSEHAGVNLIRRYYPAYVPSEEDFEKACWGTPSSETASEARS